MDDYTPEVGTEQVGRIVEVGDGIARITGLPGAAVNEILEFESGTEGLALNLDEETIGAVILGDDTGLEEEQLVKATGRILSVRVGDAPAGEGGQRPGRAAGREGPDRHHRDPPPRGAGPGIVRRQPVSEPLQTGIKAIDAMTPIGRGQRELIIGDRKTGKTTVAVDTILNQKGLGVKCIYVAIGQKESSVAQTVATLERYGALEYTVVVLAGAADPAPFKYLAPYAGCAMGPTGWTTASTPSSSMTTCPSRRRPTARCPSSSGAPRVVRPTRATCSTCTAGCWSGQPSCPTPRAGDR